MGRRIEMRAEEKEVLILECLAGRLRMREAARRAGVGHSTMHFWISRYRSEGRAALAEDGNQSKRSYSAEVRQKAVEEYLSGQGSSMAIAEKYKLRSGNLVLEWVKEYHHHREQPNETGAWIWRSGPTPRRRSCGRWWPTWSEGRASPRWRKPMGCRPSWCAAG